MPAFRSLLSSRVSKPVLVLALVTGAFLQLTPYLDAPSTLAGPGTATLSALTQGEIRTTLAPSHLFGAPIAIEGWVTDRLSAAPIANATILLNNQARTTSDSSGYFSFTISELDANPDGGASNRTSRFVQLAVRAYGHARWSISNAPFYSGDTLRIYARLDSADKPASYNIAHKRQSVPGSLSYARRFETMGVPNPLSGNALAAPQEAPPASIRVYRTATGVVETVPFRDYVKYVLPNEWIPTWGAESLKAGAMAVKTYAWYWIAQGGKQVALGADLKDNVDDQVYDPNISYASTDAAVDATFNYVMTRNGALFQAQYCAGSYIPDPTGDCPWSGTYMTQWGTAYHADQGRPWGWMVQFYYRGATITPNPPGGGYDGAPLPPSEPKPTQPPPVSSFAVGQGATRPEAFQEAYDRNGGVQTLGRPTGPVKWWLPYVTEHNVLAQPFSGPKGQGQTWLVYDVLKSNDQTGHRAFLLSGDIAAQYAQHDPPGPEWVGAPTSDPYISGPDLGNVLSQGFRKGTLSAIGQSIEFSPFPEEFGGWKAEYFVGHQTPSPQLEPTLDLPGYPASLRDVPTPTFDWSPDARVPQSLGLGNKDWSAQFTRSAPLDAGSYDLALSANSGARLWVDGLLAVNGWNWTGQQTASYNTDLGAGVHTIRIQYYSGGGAAKLDFSITPRSASQPVPVAEDGPPNAGQTASLRVSVRWLGRQSAPSESWVQPLTLQLSDPATTQVLGTYTSRTDRNGVAIYQSLPMGTYNVHVKGPHNLQSARAGVALRSNATVDIDMKAQIEGDVDGDNCVTVSDFSIVQAMIGAHQATPGYNPAADLNGDGEVTMSDVSLLRSGFDLCGDISADNQFTAMSTGFAPSFTPWLYPERLTRTLSLTMIASSTTVRYGDTLRISVIANAGDQPIDGAAFVVKYDPAVLTPIDINGLQNSAVEPGSDLPSVMGNWVDANGGVIGYSAGVLQGQPPQGKIIIGSIRFRIAQRAPGTQPGATQLTFGPTPSSLMQLTNGGVNLLATAPGLNITVNP